MRGSGATKDASLAVEFTRWSHEDGGQRPGLIWLNPARGRPVSGAGPVLTVGQRLADTRQAQSQATAHRTLGGRHPTEGRETSGCGGDRALAVGALEVTPARTLGGGDSGRVQREHAVDVDRAVGRHSLPGRVQDPHGVDRRRDARNAGQVDQDGVDEVPTGVRDRADRERLALAHQLDRERRALAVAIAGPAREILAQVEDHEVVAVESPGSSGGHRLEVEREVGRVPARLGAEREELLVVEARGGIAREALGHVRSRCHHLAGHGAVVERAGRRGRHIGRSLPELSHAARFGLDGTTRRSVDEGIERTRLELGHAVEALHGDTGGEHVEGGQQGHDDGENRQATGHGGLQRLVVGLRGGREGDAHASPAFPGCNRKLVEVLSIEGGAWLARRDGPNSLWLWELPPRPVTSDRLCFGNSSLLPVSQAAFGFNARPRREKCSTSCLRHASAMSGALSTSSSSSWTTAGCSRMPAIHEDRLGSAEPTESNDARSLAERWMLLPGPVAEWRSGADKPEGTEMEHLFSTRSTSRAGNAGSTIRAVTTS